ncbi:MAG: hypothetical protein J5855_03655 [Mailhella sp.]|nr:hypothetical protein [Mailhella sp.]
MPADNEKKQFIWGENSEIPPERLMNLLRDSGINSMEAFMQALGISQEKNDASEQASKNADKA